MVNFSKIFEERDSLIVIANDSFYENIKIWEKLNSIKESFKKVTLFLNDELFSCFSLLDSEIISHKFKLSKIDKGSMIINYSKKVHRSIYKKKSDYLYISPFGGNFEFRDSNSNCLQDIINFLDIDIKEGSFDFEKLDFSSSKEKFEVIIDLKKKIISPFYYKKMNDIQDSFQNRSPKKILFSINLLFGNSTDNMFVSKKNFRELFLLALFSELFISDNVDFLRFLKIFGINVRSTIKNDFIDFIDLSKIKGKY